LIRPILRGKDIKRYGYEWADLWLIATFPSRHYDIDLYPAVKQYLLAFGIERLEQTGKVHTVNGEQIKSRKKTNNKWFETQDSISYWEDFSKPKIVYREIGQVMDACIVPPNIVINNKLYMISGDNLEHLLRFFNSKVFNKTTFLKANLTGGKGIDFMELIHVPLVSECDLSLLEEKDIDRVLYSFYGLTTKEVDFLEDRMF
jgi:type IIS restriction enzyme R and M protein